MKKPLLLFVLFAVAGLPHETLTTTVLFDREIVRILDNHCVMCHTAGGPSFPLETYEQTQVRGRKIRAEILARHMPPWAAFPGYGQFANDNSLTLRETQFIVSWVEGLGPRNAGTAFLNIADPGARLAEAVRAHSHFGQWELGAPDLARPVPPNTIAARSGDRVVRREVDLGLATERRVSGVEYIPSDYRVVRAGFFTVRETGQWIGSWTPWRGYTTLPSGAAYRLPRGAHVIAEIHYRGTAEHVVESGKLGLHFADAAQEPVSDIVLESKGSRKIQARTRLGAAARILALRPEFQPGIQSIEVAARNPDGSTEVLLFAREIPIDWPTPYIFKEPVTLPSGTILSVTAYYASAGSIRLTASTVQ